MAEKSQALILDALTRAAAEPGGLALWGSKRAAGLFTANAAGKQAAEHSKSEGLIRVLRTEAKGKSTLEICGLTEKGLKLLLTQTNPRQVLEAFVSALEARRQQTTLLLESARASQEHLETLKSSAEKALAAIQQPQQTVPYSNGRNGKRGPDEAPALLAHLKRRQEADTLDDCPLPELYRAVKILHPGLTVGQFHDVLRRLHEDRQIYLHPWTGPLYELPEPVCALLVGHEVAYYASCFC